MSDLPSRRYTCIACGGKGRRNNSPEQRLKEPICPTCERGINTIDRYARLMPFWQKRQEDKSHEVKRMREAAAYYDEIVNLKNAWKNEPPLP